MASGRRQPLSAVLGPLENEVMEVVWARGPVTVRDVHGDLAQRRSIAYTTVMTTMVRLSDKGLLRREERHPAHLFSAVLRRDDYVGAVVKSVVDWLVQNFRGPAVAYFLERVEQEDPVIVDGLREAIEARASRMPQRTRDRADAARTTPERE